MTDIDDKLAEPTQEEIEVITFLSKVQEVLARRFPRCRGCADDGPTCPHSGLPCDLNSAFRTITAALSSRPAPAAEVTGERRIIAVVLPDGYLSGDDFAKDCNVEVIGTCNENVFRRLATPDAPAAGRVGGEWHTMDSAPKDGVRVLLFNDLWGDTFGDRQIGYEQQGKWLFDGEMNINDMEDEDIGDGEVITAQDYQPQRWRQLPAAPQPATHHSSPSDQQRV